MNPGGPAAAVLLSAGVLVVVLCGVGLLAGGSLFDRLHYLTVASSVGVPLVVAAVALAQDHPGRVTAKLAVIAVLLTAGGPVVSMATGRATAQRIGTTHPAGGREPEC